MKADEKKARHHQRRSPPLLRRPGTSSSHRAFLRRHLLRTEDPSRSTLAPLPFLFSLKAHLIHRHVLTHPSLQTLVSSSCYVYHQDADTFPDPQTFQPSRWLSNPEPREAVEAKFMPFSRGSRTCTGSNLAWAELHLITAHLFRRFDVSNGGTTEADMRWDDCFVPVTRGHLKVVVRESAE